MVDLPQPVPSRIAKLPRDHRGFPVPWFVQWISDGKACPHGEGEPDFRVIDIVKLMFCCRHPHCWVCGEPLGKHRVFTIGPMCAVNRVISEPPSHRECAEWSVKACPFLSKPRMRRNEKDLPVDGQSAAGFHIDRNPGVMCLWETMDYKPFKPHAGGDGILFKLGDPARVDWWSEGRAATRAEVDHAMATGLPQLQQMAEQDGPEAVSELAKLILRAVPLLPHAEAEPASAEV